MTRDDLLRRGWEFRASNYDHGFYVSIWLRGNRVCGNESPEPSLLLAEKAALAAFAALTS